MDICKELGLTVYEKKTYESLLKQGRSNASKLSDASKVPITAVYPALSSLLKKGLVQKYSGEIAQFEAIKPKIAITRLVNQKQKRLEELKEKAIENLENIQKETPKEKKKIIEFGIGKDFSHEIYYEVFEKARESIFILGWRFENIGDKYNILKRLKKPLKNNLDIRLILIGEKNNKQEALIKDYLDAGVKIRFLPLNDFSLLIADSSVCKITIKKVEEEKVSLNIMDENLVEFLKKYYIDLWEKAETFQI